MSARPVRRRIVSIVLPLLSIERWEKLDREARAPEQGHDEEEPKTRRLVLTREGSHGLLIHAPNAHAAAIGIRAGMRLTDARALDPALDAVPCDHAGDGALMKRLARWAGRWSPTVELDGPGSLRLDATGAAHLFGGEAQMLDDIEARLAAMGLTARTAIADTALAAWALAHFGDAQNPVKGSGRNPREGSGQNPRKGSGRGELGSAQLGAPPRNKIERKLASGALAAQLAPLPVAALRLSPTVVQTLNRLGLKTIASLSGIERRSLARRFRTIDNPLDALDRALGRIPEPLTAVRDTPPPRVLLRLKEPVADPSAAAQALDLLVPDLARQLEAGRMGLRAIELAGYRVDGSIAAIHAATALPTRDAKHLHRLLAEKTGEMNPDFGFDAFTLTATGVEPLDAAQDALGGGEPAGVAVGRLVDRIATRLGPRAVTRPVRRSSHMPERSSGWAPALGPRAATPPPPVQSRRPERLLDNPEAISVIYATPEGLPRRFVWRRAVHDIKKVAGPERIAPEWWREYGPARLRDYYRVEDQAGRGYWIFREGIFGDGRGGEPTWFIHGLFG